MGFNQGQRYVANNPHGTRQVEFAFLHDFTQRTPARQLHHQEWPAFICFAVVKKRRNTGVA